MVSGMITKGMIENGWLVSATVGNCPPADPIRVLVVRAADGHSLTAMFVGQGESLAWPSVIKDALRGLVGAASQKLRASDPQCIPKDLTPTGVRIASRSADLAPDRFRHPFSKEAGARYGHSSRVITVSPSLSISALTERAVPIGP